MHILLHVVLPVVAACLCVIVAFFVGRRWRTAYAAAKGLRNSLEARVSSLSEANAELRAQTTSSAEAHGGTVIVHAERSGVVAGGVESDFGLSGLGDVLLSVVRSGLDLGSAGREALADVGQLAGVLCGMADARASRLGFVLLGILEHGVRSADVGLSDNLARQEVVTGGRLARHVDAEGLLLGRIEPDELPEFAEADELSAERARRWAEHCAAMWGISPQ